MAFVSQARALRVGPGGEDDETPPSGFESTTFGLTSAAVSGTHPFGPVGLFFKNGDIPSSIALSGQISAQLTVKRAWDDGSVKHCIVVGRAAFTQNVLKTITVTQGTTSGGSALTSASIATAAPTASIQCGAIGTVNLSSLLASPLRTWISGPEMVECHYYSGVGADPRLGAWFHVRLYADGRMWVRTICENGNVNYGNLSSSYVPTMTIGGVAVYTNGGATLTHYGNTRYCAEGWIGTDPQIARSHSMAAGNYMYETKLVPKYYHRSPPGAYLDALTQTYTQMSNGNLNAAGGEAGFHPTLGILSNFDALTVISGDARAYRSCFANSSHYNSFGIVWRDWNTKELPKPSELPTFTAGGFNGGGVSVYTRGPLTMKPSHMPSGGYLAYLLTGDYWHFETMAMVGTIGWLSTAYDSNKSFPTGRPTACKG